MLKSINLKLVKAIFAVSLLVMMTALPAFAADFRGPTNEDDPNVTLSAEDIVRNLYTAGANVVVNNDVDKDLTAAGSSLELNGNVGDGVLAAGGTINLKGEVGGSARIIGGQVRVDSEQITEDLVVIGGMVYISERTVVVGDLVVIGGNVVMDGTVNGGVRSIGGSLTLNGQINGNVDVKAKEAFILGPKADISGTVNYSSRSEYIRDPAAKTAAVNYTPLERGYGHSGAVAFLTVAFLIKLLALVVVTWVLFQFFRRRFVSAIQNTGESFWKNVAFGLAFMILVPILAVLLFVTFVGYYVAIILLAIYVLLMLLSCIVGMAYFGSWLVSKIEKKEMKTDYLTLILGIVVVSIVGCVPVLGGLLGLILTLAALGHFVRNFKNLKE